MCFCTKLSNGLFKKIILRYRAIFGHDKIYKRWIPAVDFILVLLLFCLSNVNIVLYFVNLNIEKICLFFMFTFSYTLIGFTSILSLKRKESYWTIRGEDSRNMSIWHTFYIAMHNMWNSYFLRHPILFLKEPSRNFHIMICLIKPYFII